MRTALLEAARLRKDRGHAEPPADAHDLLCAARNAWQAHGPNKRVKRASDLAILLHLPGRLADRLNDQGDRSLFAVEVRDGERYAFAVLMRHDDDELPGFGGFCHQRMANLQEISDVREVLTGYDLEPSAATVRMKHV